MNKFQVLEIAVTNKRFVCKPWRSGGIMVSATDSGQRGLGLRPG